jgi:hypothetical protein
MKYFPLLLIVLSIQGMAQSTLFLPARSLALGGIHSVQHDEWSALQNQAGLGWQEKSALGMSGGNRYGISELSFFSGVFSMRLRNGAIAVTMQGSGYRDYRQRTAGLAYGLKITSQLSAGARASCTSFNRGETSRAGTALTADLGFLYREGGKVRIGVHYSNVSAAKIPGSIYPLPVKAVLGVSFSAAPGLDTFLELEKERGFQPSCRLGAEFRAGEAVKIRYGLQSFPFTNSLGLTWQQGNFVTDIAAVHHQHLGFSPSFSCSFQFGRP